MRSLTFRQAIAQIHELKEKRNWGETTDIIVNCLNGNLTFKKDVICINICHPHKFKKYWDLVPQPFTKEHIRQIDRLLLDRIVENIPALIGRDVLIQHYKFDNMSDNTTDKRFSDLKNRNFYITKF